MSPRLASARMKGVTVTISKYIRTYLHTHASRKADNEAVFPQYILPLHVSVFSERAILIWGARDMAFRRTILTLTNQTVCELSYTKRLRPISEDVNLTKPQ